MLFHVTLEFTITGATVDFFNRAARESSRRRHVLYQHFLASLVSRACRWRELCAGIVAKIIGVTEPRVIEALPKNI